MRLEFEPEAFEALQYWTKTEARTVWKILDLIEDTKRHPFTGLGKPEPLKHQAKGAWSRRLYPCAKLHFCYQFQQLVPLGFNNVWDIPIGATAISFFCMSACHSGLISFNTSVSAPIIKAEVPLGSASPVNAGQSFPRGFLTLSSPLLLGLAFQFLLGGLASGQSKLGEKQPLPPGKTIQAPNLAKLVALADDLRIFANQNRGMAKAVKDYQPEEIESLLAKRRNLSLTDFRKVVKTGIESSNPTDQAIALLVSGKFAESEAKFIAAAEKEAIPGDTAALEYGRAGAACTYRGDDRAALPHYQKALTLTTRVRSPQTWAALQYDSGKASVEIARLQPQEGVRFIKEAVKAFRVSLEVRTRAALPQDWAMTQNELGKALSDLADRSDPSAAGLLEREAVEVYRAALQVRTRKALPLEWAKTTGNLANALAALCLRSDKDEELELLMKQAGEAYESATEVFTFEEYPQEWAAIQGNMGKFFVELIPFIDGEGAQTTVIETAVEALQEALKVFTRQAQPRRWAIMQLNLGNALSTQARLGEKAEAKPLLAEAEQAFRAAMEVCTREAQPLEWAAAQYNLAGALKSLGDLETGEPQQEHWQAAEQAYKQALEIYTLESHPGNYQQMEKGLQSIQERLQKSTKGLN